MRRIPDGSSGFSRSGSTFSSTGRPGSGMAVAGWGMLLGEFDDATEGAQPASKRPYQEPVLMVSHVTRSYKPGLVNGTAESAAFRTPTALISLIHLPEGADEAVVVSDTGNNILRRLVLRDEEWKIESYAAGGLWLKPKGMCEIESGALLVCDSGHHKIKRVSPGGNDVTKYAGSGKKGYKDGPASKAEFDTPSGICVCPSDGSIIVADSGNNAIRRVHEGVVSTIAGGPLSPKAQIQQDRGQRRSTLADGQASSASFLKPTNVGFDRQGALLVVDQGNHSIRVISPGWSEVRTLAGGPQPGFCDGSVTACQFKCPECICVLPDGSVLVTDRENNRVRAFAPDMDRISTFAGSGAWGVGDGLAAGSTFDRPTGMCRLHSGSVIVADTGNNCLRIITDVANAPETLAMEQEQSSAMERRRQGMNKAQQFAHEIMEESSDDEESLEDGREEEMAGVGAIRKSMSPPKQTTAWDMSRSVVSVDGSAAHVHKLPSALADANALGPGVRAWIELAVTVSRSGGGFGALHGLLDIADDGHMAVKTVEGIAHALSRRHGSLRGAIAKLGERGEYLNEAEWVHAARGAGVAMSGIVLRGSFHCVDFRGLGRVEAVDLERAVSMIAEWRGVHGERMAVWEEKEAERLQGEAERRAEREREEERERELYGPMEAVRIRKVVREATAVGDLSLALTTIEEARERFLQRESVSGTQAILTELDEMEQSIRDTIPVSYGHDVPQRGHGIPGMAKPVPVSKGAHYSSRAQLFRPGKGDGEGEWVYLAAITAAVASKDGGFVLQFVREGGSMLDSRPIEKDVKIETNQKTPFWCSVRWGAGDFARTYGLRFSGGAAAKDLSNVCRDAMKMEWQRPKDSLLPRSSPPSRPASKSQREEHNDASKAAANPAQGPPGGGDRGLEGDVLRPLVENLEAALGAMDGSGRGYLTPAELREALMVLDEVEDLGMTNSQIDSLLSLVPHPPVRGPKAGLIDWREYVAAVRRECFPASSPPPPAPKGAGASSKSKQQDIVKYDHMQMAARHVPKHPMESLAASHSMIQNTSVVTSSHNVMNAPNHPSNFSTTSFLTTPKQQQQQQQQQPSPSSVESLSRSHGGDLGQGGAACREALAEMQDLMSRLRLEEVGRGGGRLTSSNSVSVSFNKLSEWAEALKEGVASASERDRLASAIPRYEEALAHTVARCAERWSGGGEGSAGLREEVEERISSVSQVFRQSLGEVGKLVPAAASRDLSSFGRAEPSGATAPDAEPWRAEGKGEAADLVNLVPGACSGMELGEYYAKLTSLLAPEALLVEWQVSDARGVGLIRDISERFHACRGAVWVRLTLWGFDYTHVDVAVGGTPTPVSGGVKYDTIKRGHYVMIRLPAESLEDDGLAGTQVTLRELRIGVVARVRHGGGERTVKLEGNMAVRLALLATPEQLASVCASLRATRAKELGSLPASLQPLGLLTARSSAKAALLDSEPN